LVGANTAVIVLPLLAMAGLRIYDVYLLRQTERELIAESVIVAEAFREAYARESGTVIGEHRPAAASGEPYVRIEPVLDLGFAVMPAQPAQLPRAPDVDTPARRAGRTMESLLRRAQTFNLSALRILDAAGCVVATTRSEAGSCMGELPEVRRALGGQYAAVARRRVSDEPPPPLGDIRRRGTERVFTALPVFADGKVIAVIRASRTGLDALSTLWANRRGLVLTLLALGVVSFLVSFGFSAAIARPLRKLTRTARAVAIASSGASAELAPKGFAPAEVVVLAEVLANMTERLEARARYVAEFAGNASHELKTPITSIRGAAELLSQHWTEMADEQRARFLANIADDAQRMERLVSRMLELARIENAGTEAVDKISVEAFAVRVLERYGEQVSLQCDTPPAQIEIAENHLHGVLANLVDNAVRHGAGKLVKVRLAAEGARLRIEVSDQGPGVSEANRQRLFQRFFTTERDRGGTGLGLAIVKAIAEARGGRVAVESGPAATTFTVVL
jgi:signal transduction histidine kinase